MAERVRSSTPSVNIRLMLDLEVVWLFVSGPLVAFSVEERTLCLEGGLWLVTWCLLPRVALRQWLLGAHSSVFELLLARVGDGFRSSASICS